MLNFHNLNFPINTLRPYKIIVFISNLSFFDFLKIVGDKLCQFVFDNIFPGRKSIT